MVMIYADGHERRKQLMVTIRWRLMQNDLETLDLL